MFSPAVDEGTPFKTKTTCPLKQRTGAAEQAASAAFVFQGGAEPDPIQGTVRTRNWALHLPFWKMLSSLIATTMAAAPKTIDHADRAPVAGLDAGHRPRRALTRRLISVCCTSIKASYHPTFASYHPTFRPCSCAPIRPGLAIPSSSSTRGRRRDRPSLPPACCPPAISAASRR